MQQVVSVLLRFGLPAVACLILASPALGAQESPKTWLDLSQEPTIDATWTLDQETFNESEPQTYKRDCLQQRVITRPRRLSPIQSEQTTDRCWHYTRMGLIASQGDALLIKPEMGIAGPVTNQPTLSTLYTTPNPSNLLDIRTGTSSNYVRFHFGVEAQTTKNSNGTVSHIMTANETFTLKNSTGSNVSLAAGQGIDFSANGKWATGVTVNYAMFRLNLETKQFLNFGAPMLHGAGWNPFMRIDVTNDGRYAVATATAQEGGQWIRVYDLDDCDGTEHATLNTVHANCTYRDLTAFLAANIPNFNRFTMASFAGNNALVFHHYNAGSPRLYTRYVLRAPNAGSESRNYLALGDSYSSGEGAHSYEGGTDENNNRCHLSRLSYPYLLNIQLGFDSAHSVACSGAKTENLNGGVAQYSKDSDDMSLGYWLPGRREQFKFLEENPVDILTIGIGGNDIGFGGKVIQCLNLGSCYSSSQEKYEAAQEITNQFDKFVSLYTKAREGVLSQSPNGKVYVVGYPQVALPGGDCGINVHLDADELDVAHNLINHLNAVIKAAAAKAGVVYVGIESALSGHMLCEDTGTPAVNGLTAGNDIVVKNAGPFGNESYHPTAFGHQLVTTRIRTVTNDLTLTMPAPDNGTVAPSASGSLLVKDTSMEFSEVRQLQHDNSMAEDLIVKESTQELSINGFEHNLRSSTEYEVVLTSTPTLLGSTYSDENGNISAQITIPETVESGFHTLHLYGKDLSGKDVDIYKMVYVAEAEEDWDGDGVQNTADSCPSLPNTSIDSDSDGIHDECDGIISGSNEVAPEPHSQQQTINEAIGPASSPNLSTPSELNEKTTSEGSATLGSSSRSEGTHGESQSPAIDVANSNTSLVRLIPIIPIVLGLVIVARRLLVS